MRRRLVTFCTVAYVLLTGISLAAAPEKKPDPTVAITLYPAPAPDPVLKYQLLPPLIDRRPGNAALQYYKALHEDPKALSDEKLCASVAEWMQMPLAELRKRQPARWLTGPDTVFDTVQRGARCEGCDWGYPIHEGFVFSIRLGELQTLRGPVGRFLGARARLQIAEGKYEDAVQTLQAGYGMARHVGQAPFLVNALVGVAIAGVMDQQVETWIQQPGAPNLYWALSTLPRPLIDFRPGWDGEMAAFYLEFPELRNLHTKQLGADQWQGLLDRFVKRLGELLAENGREKLAPDAARTAIEQGLPRAKRGLIAWGYPAKAVDAMPAAQVILLYTVRTCEQLRDESFKWLLLPYSEARQGTAKTEQMLRDTQQSGREIIPIAALLLPALGKAKMAEMRNERRLAALRILEALRLYGASHQGRLPATLAEITEVPIPLDPLAGQPFVYRRDGQTAVLESAAADPGAPPLRYQIRLAETKK